MKRQISIKTKFGWISAYEEKGKIATVKFGKCKNKFASKKLRKFKSRLNDFFPEKALFSNQIFLSMLILFRKKCGKN